MIQVIVKPLSACSAVRFLKKVNPLFFKDERLPAYVRNFPQLYFMNLVTGCVTPAVIEVPKDCCIVLDYGRREFTIEYRDSVLSFKYMVVNDAIYILE